MWLLDEELGEYSDEMYEPMEEEFSISVIDASNNEHVVKKNLRNNILTIPDGVKEVRCINFKKQFIEKIEFSNTVQELGNKLCS